LEIFLSSDFCCKLFWICKISTKVKGEKPGKEFKRSSKNSEKFLEPQKKSGVWGVPIGKLGFPGKLWAGHSPLGGPKSGYS